MGGSRLSRRRYSCAEATPCDEDEIGRRQNEPLRASILQNGGSAIAQKAFRGPLIQLLSRFCRLAIRGTWSGEVAHQRLIRRTQFRKLTSAEATGFLFDFGRINEGRFNREQRFHSLNSFLQSLFAEAASSIPVMPRDLIQAFLDLPDQALRQCKRRAQLLQGASGYLLVL